MQDMHELLVRIVGARISPIAIITAHASNVTAESRQRRADKSIRIATYNLLDHADMIVIQSFVGTATATIISFQHTNIIIEESNSELFPEGVKEGLVLLIRRNIQQCAD